MRIEINPQQICFDTGKASLIKIPNSDWQFWLTNKCVFGNSIYLNEGYTYCIAKKDTQRKGEIDGQSLIDAFKNYTVYKRTRPEILVIKHTPEYHKPLNERRVSNNLIK